MNRTPKWNAGFSLLELLIVVAIILIIATMAVPSFLRTRQSANESAAAASMKSINVAQNVYLMTNHIFAPMSALIAAGLLEPRFQTPLSGYSFNVSVTPDRMNYTASADAVSTTTGRYDFYAVADFVIRYTPDSTRAPAGMAGQPVR
jgi:prepilin-type N-terminal cleavage/methylation domain-containing protein